MSRSAPQSSSARRHYPAIGAPRPPRQPGATAVSRCRCSIPRRSGASVQHRRHIGAFFAPERTAPDGQPRLPCTAVAAPALGRVQAAKLRELGHLTSDAAPVVCLAPHTVGRHGSTVDHLASSLMLLSRNSLVIRSFGVRPPWRLPCCSNTRRHVGDPPARGRIERPVHPSVPLPTIPNRPSS